MSTITIDKEISGYLKYLNDYEICIDGENTKPILIMPPDGSNPNHFRIYAFGGDIGRVPIRADGVFKLAKDSEYSKYLNRNDYHNGNEQVFHFPTWLDTLPYIKPTEKKDRSEQEILNWLLKCKDVSKKEILVGNYSKYYLPLILAASKNRFIKKKGCKYERWVQQEIAKRYQQITGIKNTRSLIISDIEYDIPISDKRKIQKAMRSKSDSGKASKPDFVMFDGESFGIVEFKYLGKSMDIRTSNALDWHYLDFYSAIKETGDAITLEKYKECLDRLELMLDSEIIFPDDKDQRKVWINYVENARNKYMDLSKKTASGETIDPKKLFWFGFLFVGGKEIVVKGIKQQLLTVTDSKSKAADTVQRERSISEDVMKKIGNNEIELYCQYCDENEKEDMNTVDIDMSKDIKNAFNDLLKKK